MRLPGGAQQLARGPEGGERAQEPLPSRAGLYVPAGALARGRGAGHASVPRPFSGLGALPPPRVPLCSSLSSHAEARWTAPVRLPPS